MMLFTGGERVPVPTVLWIRIRKIRIISPNRDQMLGWIRNPDPYQIIRIWIQQITLKTENKFTFLTQFKCLFTEK